MLSSFFKVTIRNLNREKMYAAINIAGLSLAVACCLILGLYLKNELTYDKHNTLYKQIFRVVNDITVNRETGSLAKSPVSLGPMLAEEYHEIKGFVRFRGGQEERLFWHGDSAFYWKNIYMADDNVFEIFTHNIVYGDPNTALKDPQSVAVSESFTVKYFGNANPIGETISNDIGTYKITLVFADLPANSHLKYDLLSSYNAEPDDATLRVQRLFTMSEYTYLLMPEGYDVQDFNKISDSFYSRHMEEYATKFKGIWRFWLQPLADIHLHSEVAYDQPTANKFYLYGFAATALFILLIACINYMNLATARAAKRAREVGMRKILGAGRKGLIFRFLGESIFFSLIALFLGVALVEFTLTMTPINELLDKSLALNLENEPVLMGVLLVFGLVVGFMSGIYPAFYLSSMLPLSALVKSNRVGIGNIRIRELLVLVQFTISVSVIVCVLLMALQMRYVSQKPLGFNKENKVIITLRGADLVDKLPTIKKELLKNSNILGMAACDSVIGNAVNATGFMADNNDGVLESIPLFNMSVGEDFLDVMGLQLVAGRDFSRKLMTDVGNSFIVNETMVKKMGWKEPLNKRIQCLSSPYNGRVIGVVKDFHFASLHTQVSPFIMVKVTPGQYKLTEEARKNMSMLLVLNISGKEIPGTLAFLQKKFAEFDPMHPLNYRFLDDTLDKLYLPDQHLMKLMGILAGICIIISCMGLFGLAAFATEQRTKEIGVRKVLGASTWQIILMLSRKILLLVSGGALIGSLASYYAMDEWLSGFAYHTGINLWVFLVSAAAAAGVAFMTVALQSYKTAQANPVEALRYE